MRPCFLALRCQAVKHVMSCMSSLPNTMDRWQKLVAQEHLRWARTQAELGPPYLASLLHLEIAYVFIESSPMPVLD
jgi:hypothetical protein